ncbi:MAG: GGDEF domain-containing protein [Candidatus Gastranaerophilales bacterium]|nr:GGDEF domain-containing protein [Candidatus Gastranaerophilales bacterium]
MNIIIYTDDKTKQLENMLADIDVSVRTEDTDKILEYKDLNAGLVIMDMPLEKVKEICAVTKFDAAVLIAAEKIPQIRVHAIVNDFIKTPVDSFEFVTRVRALVKAVEYKQSLSKVTVTDELTGLYNRKYLHSRLDAEISRAKRYGTDLSCLLLDIDFFKTVNDMYGYDWGDVLLKKVAEMLSAVIRKEDILTRYGDEEFLLILPNTSESQAFIFAERFRRDIEKMEFIPAQEEERHPITISGGISSYPFLENVEENSNTIIRYAEHALYNAKKSGKNQIVQFSRLNLGF